MAHSDFDGANLSRPKGDMRPGFHDERTCVVKNLPSTWTEEILQQEFAPFQPTGVFIVTKRKDVGAERIGFVGFQGREWAIDARSTIDRTQGVAVSLATPRISQSHNTNVYVSGVPMAFNEAWFTKLCSQFGEVLESKLLTQIAARNEMATLSGFARYASIAQSDSAIANLHSAVVVPPRHLLRRGQEPKPHVLTARYATNAKNNTPLAAAQGVWFPPEYTRGIISPKNPRLEQDISQQLLLRFVVEDPDGIPGGPTGVIPSDHTASSADEGTAVSGPDTSVDGLGAIEAWKKQLQVYKKGETLPPFVVDAASKSNEPVIVGYVERAARRIPGTEYLSPPSTRVGTGSALSPATGNGTAGSAASVDGLTHGGSTPSASTPLPANTSNGHEAAAPAQEGSSGRREWRGEGPSSTSQGGGGAGSAAGGHGSGRPTVSDPASLEQRFAAMNMRGSGASPSQGAGAAPSPSNRAFASNNMAKGSGSHSQGQQAASAAAAMQGRGVMPYPMWPGMPPPGAPLFDPQTGMPLHPMAHMPYPYGPYGMPPPGYMHPAYADPAYAAHMMQHAHMMYAAQMGHAPPGAAASGASGQGGAGAAGMPDPRLMYPYGYPPPYAGMPGPYPMPARAPGAAAGAEGPGAVPGMPPGPGFYYPYPSPEGMPPYGMPMQGAQSSGYSSSPKAAVKAQGEGQGNSSKATGAAPSPDAVAGEQSGQPPHGSPMPPYPGYPMHMPPHGMPAPVPHAMYRGSPEAMPYPYMRGYPYPEHAAAPAPAGAEDVGQPSASRERTASSSSSQLASHVVTGLDVGASSVSAPAAPVPANVNKAREAALMAMCFAAENRGSGDSANSRGPPGAGKPAGREGGSGTIPSGKSAYSSTSAPSDPLHYKWPPGVMPLYDSSSPVAVPGQEVERVVGGGYDGGSQRYSAASSKSVANDEISALIANAPGGSVILSNFGRRGFVPVEDEDGSGGGPLVTIEQPLAGMTANTHAAQARSSTAASSVPGLAGDVHHDMGLPKLPSLPDLAALSDLGLGSSSLGGLGVGPGREGGMVDDLFLGLGGSSDNSNHAGMDFELLASQLLEGHGGLAVGGGR